MTISSINCAQALYNSQNCYAFNQAQNFRNPHQNAIFNFKGNDKKKGSSTGAKIGLFTLGTLATLSVADLIFAKGRHLKSIFSSGNKNIEETAQTATRETASKMSKAQSTAEATVKQTERKIYNQPIINDVRKESKTVENIVPAENFDEAVKNFKTKVHSKNVDTCANIDELVNQLVAHNYDSDKSLIGVVTRTYARDFHGCTLDVANNKIFNRRLVTGPTLGVNGQKQVQVDGVGTYLIQNLEDGRKLVSISVSAGRMDYAGRPIRNMINILSDGTEFTPLQKDMIEIISQRKGLPFDGLKTDILSIGGVYPHDDRAFKIDRDILLSSIATAKKQLKPSEIDNKFVEQALALKNGEKLARLDNYWYDSTAI